MISNPSPRLIYIPILVLYACFFLSCSVPRPTPCIKNGRAYGITDDWNIHYDWHSCYVRGLSYSQGECWDEAITQFKLAIEQSPKDRWMARSYGMHFLPSYFPHRELGIVYLEQGRTQEAIKELTLSLSFTDSAKAKYYLNKARKSWLEKTGLDQTPPRILFADNGNKKDGIIYTNASTYRIKGKAIDDYFISKIFIEHRPLFLDLAKPKVFFQKDITLKPGLNIISCKATDLTNHEYRDGLKIFLDQQGPTVVFAPFYNPHQYPDKIMIKGFVYDEGGIEELIIANEMIPLIQGEKIREFECEISLSSPPALQAKDLAGNLTEGILGLRQDKAFSFFHNFFKKSKKIKICYSGPPSQLTSSKLLADISENTLNIFIDKCPSIVYKPSVTICGWIESGSGISGIWANGKDIFSTHEPSGIIRLLQKLIYGGRTQFYFTRIIEGLEEGENHITVKAQDKEGRSFQEGITVEYKKRQIDRIGNRWRLGICPFYSKTKEIPFLVPPPPRSMDYLSECLQMSFFNTERFMMLERKQMKDLIEELGLSDENFIDTDMAPKIGRLLNAEVLLMGYMYEGWDGQDRCLEIIARLVEVETSQILSIQSVYNRWKTREDEQYLLEGLAQKFFEDFPLLQGKVIAKGRESFEMNLSMEDLLKQGMTVLVYRMGMTMKQEMAEDEENIMGEARVEKVSEGFSVALPKPKKLIQTIQVGDFVITK